MKTKTVSALGVSLCIVAACAYFTSCSKNEVQKQSTVVNTAVKSDLVIKNGLVAWYTFDGDVLDHSGNGNNVVFNNATPATGYNGQPSTAYKFNGKTNYMQVKNSPSLQDSKTGLTLCVLLQPTGFYQGLCHGNRVINKGLNDRSSGLYLIGFDDQPYYSFNGCNEPVRPTKQSFYGSCGDNQFSTIHSIAPDYIVKNTWYKVVFTCDGKKTRLYVNGELKNENTNPNFSYTSNTDDVFFGKLNNEQYPYWFNGLIDDIKIYNRALTDEEINHI